MDLRGCEIRSGRVHPFLRAAASTCSRFCSRSKSPIHSTWRGLRLSLPPGRAEMGVVASVRLPPRPRDPEFLGKDREHQRRLLIPGPAPGLWQPMGLQVLVTDFGRFGSSPFKSMGRPPACPAAHGGLWAHYPVDMAKLNIWRHEAKLFASELGQSAPDDWDTVTECWFAIKPPTRWSVSRGLWDDPTRRRAYRRGPPLVRIGEVFVYSEKTTALELREDLTTRWVALGGDALDMLPEPPTHLGERRFEVEILFLTMPTFDVNRNLKPRPPPG